MPRIKPTSPDEDSLARGAKYLSAIDADAWNRGEVLDENEAPHWRYFPRRCADNWGWGNPLRKADFVLQEPDGSGESIIRRTALFPSVFQCWTTINLSAESGCSASCGTATRSGSTV